MSRDRVGPIRVRGRVYATARDCASHLGVDVSTVYLALRNGRLDTLGQGGPSRAVTIRGETYPSMAAAARALGVSTAAISHAASRGALDNVGGRRECWPVGVVSSRAPRPVVIRGEEFSSIAEAARALGVMPATVRQAISRGTLDRVGIGRGRWRESLSAPAEAPDLPDPILDHPAPPVPVPMPAPEPVAVVPFEEHPGVAARRALCAELAQRDGPDAWPEDWFERRDPADAQRCRRLWCGVLVVSLREVLERYRKGLRGLPARGRTAEMIERVWRHAGAWIGSRDFAEVCHLAGFDPAAVAERFAGLRRDPARAELLERALRSHPSRGDGAGEAA